MLRLVQITDVFLARSVIADVQQRAALRGIGLRQPPPEPTTCCGRGCNGCVWEGYFGAMQFWIDDAQAAFDDHDRISSGGPTCKAGAAPAV